jgi:hypothetical protein
MSSEDQPTHLCTRPRRPLLGREVIWPVLALLGVLALVIWRQTADSADIGEPFDVQSFASISIPDDQNAFTYYRRATQRFVDEPTKAAADPSQRLVFTANVDEVAAKGFQFANDDCRKWLEDNRRALDLWKRGSRCSEAIEITPDELGLLNLPNIRPPLQLSRLALLEAARLTAAGSPAQAWEWYRASLRCGRHLGMQAGEIGRLVGLHIHEQSVPPILNWSANSKLGADDLRRALAGTQAAYEMTPPPSETIKFEYLSARATLKASFAQPSLADRLRRFPHRLEQAVKLISANWLSQVDRPRYLRAPVVEVGIWDLFELDATTPPDFVARSPHEDVYAARSPHADDSARSPHEGDSARSPHADDSARLPRGRGADVCTPAEIDKRCGLSRRPMQEATQGLLMPGVTVFLNAVDRERTRHAALVLGLALELYHREHGQFPAALAELVEHKYLPSIPIDPFGKGESFHYRREVDPKQGATLWSFWLDGVDQHGAIPAIPPAPGGDLVFRIERPR